jgi:hypothetical protein
LVDVVIEFYPSRVAAESALREGLPD